MSDQLQKNKAILQRLYDEVWNEGKLAAADEILAQPDSVKRYIDAFRRAVPDIRHTGTRMVAEGDTVVAYFTASGTHTEAVPDGQWSGLQPSHKPFTFTGMTIARLENGKIIEHETVWDRLSLLQQVDVIPPVTRADGSPF